MPTKSKNQNSTKWIISAVVIVVLITVAAIFVLGRGSEAEALSANISVSEAASRFKDGAFLLDVRQPEEWAQAHIDGAVLIPLGELQSRLSEIPTDRDVLIICRSGNRSSQARDILRAAGFERTTSIVGGMNGWIADGLPVVTGN